MGWQASTELVRISPYVSARLRSFVQRRAGDTNGSDEDEDDDVGETEAQLYFLVEFAWCAMLQCEACARTGVEVPIEWSSGSASFDLKNESVPRVDLCALLSEDPDALPPWLRDRLMCHVNVICERNSVWLCPENGVPRLRAMRERREAFSFVPRAREGGWAPQLLVAVLDNVDCHSVLVSQLSGSLELS